MNTETPLTELRFDDRPKNLDALENLLDDFKQNSHPGGADSKFNSESCEPPGVQDNLESFVFKSNLALERSNGKSVAESGRLQLAAKFASESENRWQIVINMIPALAWVCNQAGEAFDFNEQWFDYTGFTPEQSRGLGWSETVHPDDRQQYLQIWHAARSRVVPCEAEARYRRRDGEYRWFLTRALPVRDGANNVNAWFGTSIDIEDRKRFETNSGFLSEASRALAASLDYETTLEQIARLAVPRFADWCLIDVLEDHVSINRLTCVHAEPEKIRLARQMGRRYKFDLAANDPIARVLRTGKTEFSADIADPVLTDSARDAEHLRELRSFGLRSYIIVPIVARSQTLGAISLATAESARRFSQADVAFVEELARRTAAHIDNVRQHSSVVSKQSEAGSRLKDEFLDTVSHELRTPLNAILGWCQMMQSGKIPASQSAYALEIIERNARSQSQLINDLLDASRLFAGNLQLDLSAIPVDAIISRALDAVRSEAEAKRIELVAGYDLTIETIVCDPLRLQQMIGNLLINAVKFTPDNGRVEIRTARSKDCFEIVVTDTGQGIAREFLPFVFDRFRQADSSTTRLYGGLGLGLTIVQSLARLHGGTVRAHSDGIGTGASFTLSLPIMPAAHKAG